MPMKQLSRSVVFVNTNPKNERITVLKNNDSLSQLNDDDTNVFQKSLIDRYQHRPQQLKSRIEFQARGSPHAHCVMHQSIMNLLTV